MVVTVNRHPSSISSFTGSYRFLSNFYRATVHLDGVAYLTVEHAFQAAKTLSLVDRARISQALNPGRAKAIGRTVALRNDWEAIKLNVMLRLLREKFSTDFLLRSALLSTNDAELIEGNYWNDTFWGVSGGKGENHLGKLLMKVRAELQRAELQAELQLDQEQ